MQPVCLLRILRGAEPSVLQLSRQVVASFATLPTSPDVRSTADARVADELFGDVFAGQKSPENIYRASKFTEGTRSHNALPMDRRRMRPNPQEANEQNKVLILEQATWNRWKTLLLTQRSAFMNISGLSALLGKISEKETRQVLLKVNRLS